MAPSRALPPSGLCLTIPVTAAGPRRTCTGFPILPQRGHLMPPLSRGHMRLANRISPSKALWPARRRPCRLRARPEPGQWYRAGPGRCATAIKTLGPAGAAPPGPRDFRSCRCPLPSSQGRAARALRGAPGAARRDPARQPGCGKGTIRPKRLLPGKDRTIGGQPWFRAIAILPEAVAARGSAPERPATAPRAAVRPRRKAPHP